MLGVLMCYVMLQMILHEGIRREEAGEQESEIAPIDKRALQNQKAG